MDELLSFLRNQRLLTLATVAEDNTPWLANAYYGVGENMNLYFISSRDTEHSRHIEKNSKISFGISWFEKTDHTNRKAVQGKGICRLAAGDEITTGVALHNEHFPEFADRVTVEWIHGDDNNAVWVIKPTYIKYWDDALYGNNGTREFHF